MINSNCPTDHILHQIFTTISNISSKSDTLVHHTSESLTDDQPNRTYVNKTEPIISIKSRYVLELLTPETM